MAQLLIRTLAHKSALIKAVIFMKEQLEDRLSNTIEELHDLSSDLSMVTDQVNRLRQKLAFLNAFDGALQVTPAGVGLYLEGIEVEVLHEGLESVADVESKGEAASEVVSTANIQRIIANTKTSWGATDVGALAAELQRQLNEALNGDGAAQEMLDALNAQR